MCGCPNLDTVGRGVERGKARDAAEHLAMHRANSHSKIIIQLKMSTVPWPSSSVGESVVLMLQGCEFDPWLGHIQESTHECLNT